MNYLYHVWQAMDKRHRTAWVLVLLYFALIPVDRWVLEPLHVTVVDQSVFLACYLMILVFLAVSRIWTLFFKMAAGAPIIFHLVLTVEDILRALELIG